MSLFLYYPKKKTIAPPSGLIDSFEGSFSGGIPTGWGSPIEGDVTFAANASQSTSYPTQGSNTWRWNWTKPAVSNPFLAVYFYTTVQDLGLTTSNKILVDIYVNQFISEESTYFGLVVADTVSSQDVADYRYNSGGFFTPGAYTLQVDLNDTIAKGMNLSDCYIVLVMFSAATGTLVFNAITDIYWDNLRYE